MVQRYSLVDAESEGDFRPEAGVLHRLHLFLRVAVDVHVEHQAAEGGAQAVGQPVVLHAPEEYERFN